MISIKGFPLQAGKRWVIERTNSWHNRGFKKLAIRTERRTRVVEAFIALANPVIITRRLLADAWTIHRWANRPTGQPDALTYLRSLKAEIWIRERGPPMPERGRSCRGSTVSALIAREDLRRRWRS